MKVCTYSKQIKEYVRHFIAQPNTFMSHSFDKVDKEIILTIDFFHFQQRRPSK